MKHRLIIVGWWRAFSVWNKTRNHKENQHIKDLFEKIKNRVKDKWEVERKIYVTYIYKDKITIQIILLIFNTKNLKKDNQSNRKLTKNWKQEVNERRGINVHKLRKKWSISIIIKQMKNNKIPYSPTWLATFQQIDNMYL